MSGSCVYPAQLVRSSAGACMAEPTIWTIFVSSSSSISVLCTIRGTAYDLGMHNNHQLLHVLANVVSALSFRPTTRLQVSDVAITILQSDGARPTVTTSSSSMEKMKAPQLAFARSALSLSSSSAMPSSRSLSPAVSTNDLQALFKGDFEQQEVL